MTASSVLLEVFRGSILILTALFPIVNPLGNSPIFLGLTQDYGSQSRVLLAKKIAINGFFLLVASLLTGTHILAFFGISLPVVQVGGGLLVIATGWEMLQRRDDPSSKDARSTKKEVDTEDLSRQAFYPLTLPLTVGPGTISVAITVGANEHQTGPAYISLINLAAAVIGSALVALTIYLCYRFAETIAKLLGDTAMSVVLRLSSFILLCIGVQIAWNGVSALAATLMHAS